MQGHGVIDIVLLVVSGVMMVASIFGPMWKFRPRQFLSSVQASLRSARERLAAHYHKASTDEVDMLLQVQMQKLKVDHLRWSCRVLHMMIALVTAYMILNIIVGAPRNYTFSQSVIHLFMHGVCVVVVIFPGLLTWKTIDVIIGLLMLASTAFTSPWTCRLGREMISIEVSTGIAVLLSIVRRSPIISTVFNSLMVVSVVGTICDSSRSIQRPVILSCLEVVVLTIFPMFGYMLDVSIGKGIRSSLEMQLTKEVLSAASALLRSCCDVVVELDTEGTIVDPGHDLGVFLLRNGRGRSLVGSKLSDLFSLENYKKKFLKKLSAPEPSSPGLAEAIHVRMRGANHELLRVEIMWFGFRRLDGSRHFMVGLREFPDISAQFAGHSPHHVENTEMDSSDVHTAKKERDASHKKDTQQSNYWSDGSATSSQVSDDSMSREIQVASITVDATRPGIPIQGYTPGFRSRIGRLPLGSNFTAYLKHQEDFSKWLQNTLNAVNGSMFKPPDYQATLVLRQGKLKATCRVLLDEEDSALCLSNVELAFFSIRHCQPSCNDPCSAVSPTASVGPLRGTPVGRMSI